MSAKTLLSRTLYFVRQSMIYEQIKRQAMENVPFARLAGVQVVEVGRGQGQTRLTQRPELCNHVGTLHAAALFALGETASGLAMAGALAPVILAVRPVASDARIRYLKPARGTITALGRVAGEPDALVRELQQQGKLRFEVTVALADEAGVQVAEMAVEWHARLER